MGRYLVRKYTKQSQSNFISQIILHRFSSSSAWNLLIVEMESAIHVINTTCQFIVIGNNLEKIRVFVCLHLKNLVVVQ